MVDYLTSALATLLVVADPLLLSALFLALTHGMSDKERREVALRGTLIAFLILVATGLGGAKLLDLLGISISAFRISGGLLLLWSAAEMVFDRRGQRLRGPDELFGRAFRRHGPGDAHLLCQLPAGGAHFEDPGHYRAGRQHAHAWHHPCGVGGAIHH
jgi:hypothetical protein